MECESTELLSRERLAAWPADAPHSGFAVDWSETSFDQADGQYIGPLRPAIVNIAERLRGEDMLSHQRPKVLIG